MLRHSPAERGRPHRWGPVQEAAVVDAAVTLGRRGLRWVAVSSGNARCTERAESGVVLPHVEGRVRQRAVSGLQRGDNGSKPEGADRDTKRRGRAGPTLAAGPKD